MTYTTRPTDPSGPKPVTPTARGVQSRAGGQVRAYGRIARVGGIST
ncbi:hypothetical protein M8Z33_21045 [Streptomyces sp. ZAF1911]|nr:hypothetical protein [Streptomyces sp. ZAF1911]MDD9379100.1 hypothetical protein [Streptomyces sp. ZAF1911]